MLNPQIDFDSLITEPISTIDLNTLMLQSDFFKLPIGVSSRLQSAKIDQIIGMNVSLVEKGLTSIYQSFNKRYSETSEFKRMDGGHGWVGLDPQTLQTPYSEIHAFLTILKVHSPKSVIALGSGYSRVGLVLNYLIPDATFIGLELFDTRIQEAKRVFKKLLIENSQMFQQNILEDDFVIPKADVYFIYDFSDPIDICKILDQLSRRFHDEKCFIVARGDGVRSLINLKYPEFWALNGAHHGDCWTIYSSYVDFLKN